MTDIRIGAYGVIIVDGSILLTHWHDGGAWTLPGGGLELGEEPTEAAIREIREETGLTASLERLLGIHTVVIPGERRLNGSGVALHAMRVVYRASVEPGELVIEVDGSSDDARWVPLTALGDLPVVDLVHLALELDRREPPTGSLG
ncbi:NUDIX hydrolase [Nakamurella deserti]|uniref:NUDIX hydrolase n=1 Tax=Nakamurella deserti TaxID=2164074 RepID=UPI000DBE9AA8|nr:NUDIX domain-containing protein [Nakamurella deserti]